MGWLFSASTGQSWASALRCWAPRSCCWVCLRRQLNLFSSPDLFAVHLTQVHVDMGSAQRWSTRPRVEAWNCALLAWMDEVQVRLGIKPHLPQVC